MNEVLTEKRGMVQWITINREERRNAMNDAVVFGIMAGLTAATSDPDVRAVVLTGAGDGHNDTAQALASALPNGRYIMVPGHHFTAMTTPQFESAMAGFLKSGQPAG